MDTSKSLVHLTHGQKQVVGRSLFKASKHRLIYAKKGDYHSAKGSPMKHGNSKTGSVVVSETPGSLQTHTWHAPLFNLFVFQGHASFLSSLVLLMDVGY